MRHGAFMWGSASMPGVVKIYESEAISGVKFETRPSNLGVAQQPSLFGLGWSFAQANFRLAGGYCMILYDVHAY